MKHVYRCLSIYLAFSLSLTACQKQPEKQSGPPDKVTIAYVTASHGYFLFDIACAKGFFTEEGLDVTLQPHSFGKVALDALIEGKADIATSANTPIMFAVMAGKKLGILAVIETANKNTGLIARKDRGILKPSDLRGKTIGVTKGTTGDFLLDIMLTINGIEKNRVKIINLPPDKMGAALAAGQVDAVSTWHPFLIGLQKNLKNNGITFYADTSLTEMYSLTAGQDFIKQHPETIRKVLRGLLKAAEFTRQNPVESQRLVAEFLKMDRALLSEVWDIYHLRVTLDQALLVDLESESKWAISRNLTLNRKIPNYLDLMYLDGLLKVKPEAVNIIR